MTNHSELSLAQAERRLCAGERCVQHQRELLKRHIDSGLSTDVPLQRLAEVEAALLDLRRCRNRIREGIAASNTQRLLDLFWVVGRN